jgi:hypothetical protein
MLRLIEVDNDNAVLVYTGTGYREADAPAFVGAMSSAYHRTVTTTLPATGNNRSHAHGKQVVPSPWQATPLDGCASCIETLHYPATACARRSMTYVNWLVCSFPRRRDSAGLSHPG